MRALIIEKRVQNLKRLTACSSYIDACAEEGVLRKTAKPTGATSAGHYVKSRACIKKTCIRSPET